MADIQIVGNVGNIDLRYTPSGKAALNLSIAENHRRRDQSGEWQDDGTTWWRATVWDRQAETLAETLTKGDRVLVTGQVRSRDYEKDGEKRTVYDVNARHVAVIPKAPRNNAPAGGQSNDPWATAATPGDGFSDQPPF